MALIQCPQCESAVSDKAVKCPQCGADLTPTQENLQPKTLKCEECGEEFEEGATACPKCGCPVTTPEPEIAQKVDVSSVSIKVSQQSRKKIVAVIVAVVILALAGIGIKVGMDVNAQQQAEKAAADYKTKLSTATTTMLTGAAAAERVGGMIHDVWYNTIYKKSDNKTDEYTKSSKYSYSSSFNDDFNTSISNYMASSDYKSFESSIAENQDMVQRYMKELQNPPDEHSDAYGDIKELYDAYCEIVNCALNPSGNLSSFTSTFNDADTAFSKKYDAMKLYFE